MIIIAASEIGSLEYIKLLLPQINKYKITKNYREFIKIVKKYNNVTILTGTCIGYKLDKQIISYCVKHNIKSISILDSWGNYEERFFFNKKKYIPDYVIVNDLENYKQLKKIGIKKSKIFIGGNPIIQKYIIKYNKNNYINQKNIFNLPHRILFISEPYKENFKRHYKKYLFDEFSVLRKIISINKNSKILIKLHPSEDKNKYKNFTNENIKVLRRINYNILNGFNFKIIGMTSILLIKLSLIHNRVYSFIPNNTKSFLARNTFNIQFINSLKALKNIKDNDQKNKKKFNFKSYKNSKKIISNFINVQKKI